MLRYVSSERRKYKVWRLCSMSVLVISICFYSFGRVVLSLVWESRSSSSSSDKTNAWMQSGTRRAHTHTHALWRHKKICICNLCLIEGVNVCVCVCVRHARKHFSQAEGGQLDEVRQVMGMLAFPSDTHISPYKVTPMVSPLKSTYICTCVRFYLTHI